MDDYVCIEGSLGLERVLAHRAGVGELAALSFADFIVDLSPFLP